MVRKYGWAFVLFVGIPYVAFSTRVPTGYLYYLATSSNTDSQLFYLWVFGANAFTTVVMLGVLYSRVRNTGQSILRLAWCCTLVIVCLSTALYFGAALAGFGDSPAETGESLRRQVQVSTLASVLSLLPLLWFARRASRASLTHAFFLVFIIGGVPLPDLPESLPFYVGWLWGLADNLLAVWLLANFEVRGLSFRRSAAAVVVLLDGLAFLPLLWTPLLFPLSTVVILLLFPLMLVLIYLVRVRRSPVQAGHSPGGPRALSGDER